MKQILFGHYNLTTGSGCAEMTMLKSTETMLSKKQKPRLALKAG